jgi:hypothetical protein
MPVSDEINLKNRYAGQVDGAGVLWVFFGGPATPFDHARETDLAVQAEAAFEQWGGAARLAQCASTLTKP